MKNKILFAVLICAVAILSRNNNCFGEALIIDRIEIKRSNIFDLEKEKLPFFPYGIINMLHITTREGVIRRELLFTEGSYIEKHILEEAERRLRAFPFIRVAEISVSEDKDVNTALVYAQDSWTTEPHFSIKGGGGATGYLFGFREKNFLGLGKDVGYFYSKNEENKISRQIFYNDPHFLPGFWELGAMYSDRNDGSIKHFALQRPYYELEAPWMFDFTLLNEDVEKNIYEMNQKISALKTKKHQSRVFAGGKLYSDSDSASRFGIGYIHEKGGYGRVDPGDLIDLPKDYNLNAAGINYSYIKHNYIKTTNVDSFAKVEDYNLGGDLDVTLGYSPRHGASSSEAFRYEAEYSKGFSFSRQDFIVFNEKLEGLYMSSKPRNLVFESGVSYYNKYFERQTIACNMLVKLGRNLDADERFVLGGLNGLRGYPVREFNGTKLFLVNLEDRFFFVDEFLALCGLGGVVFFDAGYVWDESQAVRARDIKSDIGFGLRFAFTRSSQGLVLRLDFAYALEQVRDEKRFVVSFGSKQSF